MAPLDSSTYSSGHRFIDALDIDARCDNVKAEAAARSKVVATIGLHGSASTWVFNVVRELMIASFGENRISAVYTEELGELPSLSQAGQYVLVKSHSGAADLAWLQAVESEIVLSVRDPRDAAISMSQRFNAQLERAARWLARDCRRMMELGDRYPLLRYEDRFFEDRATVAQLAASLGLEISPAVIETIFATYATAAMRSRATELADRGTAFDQVTQIHRGHIGDTRSGKWRDLPEPVRIKLTQWFDPFLKRFGYL